MSTKYVKRELVVRQTTERLLGTSRLERGVSVTELQSNQYQISNICQKQKGDLLYSDGRYMSYGYDNRKSIASSN